MSQVKRLVLAGGSGLIGRALTKAFSAHGAEVVVLTRTPRKHSDGVREVAWDGEHLGEWIQVLDGAEAVINLTGKNIDCPHTPANLAGLIHSRVASVQTLAAAVQHVQHPPRVWVQASAVGFYGGSRDRICDETSPNGSDALAGICREWEGAFNLATTPHTRRVALRIGFVLSREGGALPVLSRLTRWFLGGAAGGGKQYISWIHLADLVKIFELAVADETFSGPLNAVAPAPVTNAEFMRALRRALHRPWSPPAPVWAVKLGARLMGSEPSLALSSLRCVPKRLLAAGFEFQYPELRGALEDLCRPA